MREFAIDDNNGYLLQFGQPWRQNDVSQRENMPRRLIVQPPSLPAWSADVERDS